MLGDDSIRIEEADSTTTTQDEQVTVEHDIVVTATHGDPDEDTQAALTQIMEHMLGRLDNLPVLEWVNACFQQTGIESLTFRQLGNDDRGFPLLQVTMRDFPSYEVVEMAAQDDSGEDTDRDVVGGPNQGEDDSFSEMSSDSE